MKIPRLKVATKNEVEIFFFQLKGPSRILKIVYSSIIFFLFILGLKTHFLGHDIHSPNNYE